MNRISFSRKSSQRGVALIEAMVAILLFSIGVLAVAGLQASMLRNTGDSKYRADASYIAQQMLGRMYIDPSNAIIGNYNTTTDIPSNSLPNGKVAVIQNVLRGPYTIIVGWTAPGEAVTPDSTAFCQMPVAHCYMVDTGIAPNCYPGDANC